jgi:hypothetical protein
MKKLLKISFLTTLLFTMSCDLDGDLNNPNEVNADGLDVNLLLNKVQAEFGDFVSEVTDPTMELTRMTAMIGGDTYDRAYQGQDFDEIWNRAYRDVLIQIETLLPAAEELGYTFHTGSAKILKAYTIVTLVDVFGDIPYSKALKGAVEFNPDVDPGRDVYDAALVLLDEAITELGTPVSGPALRDIYYGGDEEKWITLAKTLKLKIYLNLRLVDKALATTEINELIAENDLIDTDEEEFTYRYGTSDVPLRSRHPLYRQMYKATSGSADGYLGNYFMHQAYMGKGVEDPRWRFYFFRQVGSLEKALDLDPESIPCILTPKPAHYPSTVPFCAFDPGFYGRDHGNSDGIPPDAFTLTTFGVYPAGGRLDLNGTDTSDPDVAGFASETQLGQGANGAGIEPIMMASFTYFMVAEAELMLNADAAAARTALISAVNKSIDRVQSFAEEKRQVMSIDVEPLQTAYQAKVEELYDNAGTDAQRLAVIIKEYYLAAFGNGIEAYNMYRRTGYPEGIQPVRAALAGDFHRSLLYPSDFVNLNEAVDQKATPAIQVFWDTNPAGFIK